MFTLPTEDVKFRICGIDPGSDTLGLSLVQVDLLSGEVDLLESSTYTGSSMLKQYPLLVEIHGARTARLWAHQDNLERQFKIHRPHAVYSESPFLGRFPQAFAALTECITAIRRATFLYDPLMQLNLVDPPTVKLAVGVKAKGTDKNDVKKGLQKVEWLNNPNGINIESLDEHSVDSICVALTRAKALREHILKQPRILE